MRSARSILTGSRVLSLIALRECVDAITVSPYAGEAYAIEVRQEIESLDPALAKLVELSVLSERRYKANF
jgi:hypothetical protein